MAYTLLVSNPPHGRGNTALAAPHLGLSAPDLALKAKYPIPEIWAAEDDTGRIAVAARAAAQGGLTVVTVPGHGLLGIPARAVLGAVTVGEAGVSLQSAGARLDLTWDAGIIGVYFTPRADAAEAGPRTVRAQGAPCDAAFFDLYVPTATGVQRYTALSDATAFRGLGGGSPMSPAGRLPRLVQLCEERCTSAQIDRRLVNMQVRHWPPPGPSPKLLLRKGYSFASSGLAELLGKLGPSLVKISHCELSSRLVYLTLRVGEL